MADENQVNQEYLDEISILGNIIVDDTGDSMLNAGQHLLPEDFTDVRNREIFRACLSLNKKGLSIDNATLTQELKNTKMYDAVGGDAYLGSIIDKTVRIAPIQSYISSVKERALLNRFLNKLDQVLNTARTTPINDVNEFIGSSADEIIGISQQRSVAQARSMNQISEDLVDRLVKQSEEFKKNGKRPNGVTGQETGFGRLDFLTKGWHKGDMVVVGARPSVGKTAFALNLLYQVAKRGQPVIFFSLEMGAESIALRLLSNTANMNTDDINSLMYKPGSTRSALLIETSTTAEAATASRLQKGINELASLPFYVDDGSSTTMMDISTKCKKIQNQIRETQKKELGLIAIDYIGLINSPGGKGNSDSRQQEVSQISREIKQMARQLQVPVIALTQLSRDSEKRPDHKPQMSDIRESGSIEQDADMIMMLYRADYYNKGDTDKDGAPVDVNQEKDPISQVEVNLIKNRNGQTGFISFIFDKEHCSFTVEEKTDEQEF